jgi:exopolysaccharide production protein ExoY
MSGYDGFLPPLWHDTSGGSVDDICSGRYACSLIKRTFDLVVCLAVLICCAPLMVLIALLLRLSGPVLFKQERVGLDGQKFVIFKFRTMVVDAEQRLHKLLAEDPAARREWDVTRKLTKDPRITLFGRFLRLSSLDELPQLFNVLRGDMSVVGPRPIIESEMMMYNRYILHYMSVKPGLTGLWQVSGRSGTSYRRRVAFDVIYSRQASLGLDFGILLKTIPTVLLAEGAR